MDETYTVKVTDFAAGRLLEIRNYIADVLGEPSTAKRLLETLEGEISSLNHFPNRVALTDEEPWHSYGIRKMPVKNFIVYFWVDEVNRKVQVTSVVYGRRNQNEQLANMGL